MPKKYQNIFIAACAVIFTLFLLSNIREIRDAGIGLGRALQESFSNKSK
jgi:hypothetical protein